jgi:hypothetical protein
MTKERISWISVTDGLPHHAEKGIVTLWNHPEMGRRIVISMLDKKDGKPYWHYFGGDLFSDRVIKDSQCVTHWIRLPELPQ